ncbi:MAG: hypothetical protein FWG50_06315 [Kiritimatiellaeota bacterium]|nr:hypothetical protein [Kiritimatiellota bacterium]
MNKHLTIATILMAVYAVRCVAQTETAEAPVVNAKVTLADGSQLLGASRAVPIALTTSFGKMQIPLEHISALDFNKDGAKVKFHNRDVLSGKLDGEVFELTTVFKEVKLPYTQMKSVQFSKQHGSAIANMDEQGLLLHVRFDADDEDLSRFNARMETRNVQIVEGPEGDAMLLGSENAAAIITLPFTPYRMNEGTIEFWAKISQPDQRWRDGVQPWFFNVDLHEKYPGCHFGLGFAINNGNGMGGLICHAMGILASTHRFGAVSTVEGSGVLGDTPDGWHHYAMIWKRDGLDFAGADGKALLVKVDGRIVASTGSGVGAIPPDIEHIPGIGTRFIIHDPRSTHLHPFAMAGLKIWDHAKLPDKQVETF